MNTNYKLGIISFASPTGLGNQTYEYCNNLNPQKILVVDLSRFNNMPVNKDWYAKFPNVVWVSGIPQNRDIDIFLDGIDIVLVAETPLNYYLYTKARELSIKTVQVFNYEFLDFFAHPEWTRPDVFAAPTSWNIDNVAQFGEVIKFPVPINRQTIPFRVIDKCETFVHIVGRPAVHDRNGTLSFLEASEKLGNKYKYLLYYQKPKDRRATEYFEPVRRAIEKAKTTINLEVVTDVPNYADLYSRGSVLVMPRRYGGLCLPAQEALSAGMPVIMTNISPNDDLLLRLWMVNAKKTGTFYAHVDVDIYEANVNNLASKMDMFNYSHIMRVSNDIANDIAEKLSWYNMKDYYMERLQEICGK